MSETIPKSRLDETAELRKIISDCAAALPNGAFVSPDTSLGFMAHLPSEISACCARLKAESEALSATVEDHDAHVARLIEQGQQAEYERGKAMLQVEELTKERDKAVVAVDAFADICDELGCERDNEAGLMAALNLKEALASITAERDAMREVLKPFGEFGWENTNAEGWVNTIHREGISDWFGPSDFRRARALSAEVKP